MNSSHGVPQLLCTAFDCAVEKRLAFLSKDIRGGKTLRTFAGACISKWATVTAIIPRKCEDPGTQSIIYIAHAVTMLCQQMGYVGEVPEKKSNALVPEC